MKKLTLTITLALIISITMGQTKIGNITVSDSVAKKFFLYLYKHPQKIKERGYWLYDNGSGSYHISQEQKIADEAYNKQIADNSIGFKDGCYLVPHKPTEINFIKWINKKL
jgi:hypothetical protein